MTFPEVGDFPPQFQDLIAERQARYAALAERGAVAARLRDRLATLSATATSPRGEVRVTVTSSGLLSDVTFTHRGIALGPTGLARVTLNTLRRALARLAEDVAAQAAASGGGPVADATVAEYRRSLAEPLAHLGDTER